MIALIIMLTGAAVAMAAFHLARAVTSMTPRFDRETLDEFGLLGAFAVYCGAGPVLLAGALDGCEGGTVGALLRKTLVLTLLIVIWTGALGVLALEGARVLL